eukprot:55629_1
MPYHPQQESMSQSQNSSQSQPMNSMNDSQTSALNTDPLPLNTAHITRTSILVNTDQALINQTSHKIPDNEDIEVTPEPMNTRPITSNKTYDDSDLYMRQGTMSNGSYYDAYSTRLYPAVSERHEVDSDHHLASTNLPNATSIALDDDHDMKTSNKVNKPARKLSLTKHFSNDVKAFETWMSCCDMEDVTFGYYSALYPLLCEIFAENTHCSRVPKQCDLEEVLLKHGATKMKISKFRQMDELSGTIHGDIMSMMNRSNAEITPPHTPLSMNQKHMATVSAQYSGTISFDFDNPLSKPQYLVTIKHKSFFKFWKWFMECCKIIRELAHLWEANHQSTLQCNLFCGREESNRILDQAPQGTFMLRLSSVIKGGIVLSYVEPSYKKDKRFKHTILIRRKKDQYELRSQAKKRNNTKKRIQLTTISTLVRSFVKIKFLYTPHNLYPKKSIF